MKNTKTGGIIWAETKNRKNCFGRKYKWNYFWKNTNQKDLCILHETQTGGIIF